MSIFFENKQLMSNSSIVGAIALGFTLSIFFSGGSTQFLLGCWFLLLSASAIWLLPVLGGQPLSWSAMHSLSLVYMIYLFVNLYSSVLPENSITVTWALLVMPITLILCRALTKKKWLSLMSLILIPCLFSAFWGIAEFLQQGIRGSGPGGDPSLWVSSMNLVYFLLLSVYLSTTNRYSNVVLCSIAILTLAVCSGYSRVGNFNFIAALLFVAVIASFNQQLRKKTGFVLLIAITSFAVVYGTRDFEDITKNDEGYLNIESMGWTMRFAQWQAGVDQYIDYPVTGSGLGTFKVLYPAYRNVGDLHTAGNYVHNDYIQFLAEGGPLLLTFVVLFLIFLIFVLWRSVHRFIFQKQFELIEPIILIVAMGTVLVHALMSFTLYSLSNQILMGCCLARLLYVLGLLRERSLKIGFPKMAKSAVALVTVYIMIVNSLDFISADLVYGGGFLPIKQGKPDDNLALYETLSLISRIRPGVAANKFAMAAFYRASFNEIGEDEVDARRSLSIVTALEYQQGLKINPFQFQVRYLFVEFLQQNPLLMRLEEIYHTPETLLREGLELGPCYIRNYLPLINLLENSGRLDEAYSMMVAEALPWSGLRYDNYRTYRLTLFKKILRVARAKQDTEVLEKLLAVIGK